MKSFTKKNIKAPLMSLRKNCSRLASSDGAAGEQTAPALRPPLVVWPSVPLLRNPSGVPERCVCVHMCVCGALCRQQRPRVHVPAEGPRGPEAGRESHAAVRSGQHAAGQRPGVLTQEPQVVTRTDTHWHQQSKSKIKLFFTVW